MLGRTSVSICFPHSLSLSGYAKAFAEKVDEEKSSLWVLHQAATDGDEVRIKSLLQQKADATLADQSGRTPLHYAGLHGHKDVFSLLVQHGASLLTRDEDNRTAVGYLEDNYPDSFRDLLVTGVLEGHGRISIWLQRYLLGGNFSRRVLFSVG